MDVKIKYWVYQHYFFITVSMLTIAVILIYWFWNYVNDFRVIFTIAGGLVSFFYFMQKQQLEELSAFKELFTEFNRRYDALNDELNEIAEKDDTKKLCEGEIKILYDYFNLCGEEYLFYQKGYIYPKVWKAWCNGIESYLKHEQIGGLWKEEEKSDSYYGLTRTEIQKQAKAK